MATYYVDQTLGVDTNNGLSPTAPWKTINKVNTSSFSAGDSILFKRAELWLEQLTVPSSGSDGSPITFGAYGSGDGPEIKGGTKSFSATSQSYLTISGINFNGKEVYMTGSTAIIFNYCVVKNSNANGFNFVDSPSCEVNNCLSLGNNLTGVLGTGATTTVTIKNSIIAGNGIGGGYGINATSSASVTYSYSLISGNNYWATNNIGSTPTDGGNNLIKGISQIKSYINNNIYACFTVDDTATDYFNACATALESYGGRATFFPIASSMTADQKTLLADLAARGHEIGIHGWSHSDLSKTTGFQVTSTNTTPTVNIDMANSQIILWCDEIGNRVTVDWSSADKSIADLKTAVSGKGWTINNTTDITNSLKLSSLADSGGAQATPYTTNLDISAGNGYPFWREEIEDARDWTTTVTGITPTTIAYPYGNTTSNLKTYLQSVAGLAGARDDDQVLQRLNSIDVYGITVIIAGSQIKGTGGTEAEVRANTRHFYELIKHLGGIFIILTHTESNISATQLGWVADELSQFDIIFQTFAEIINAIKTSHSTTDYKIYTKNYNDILDGHLQPTSPCRDAGVDVGLTRDYAGKPVPRGMAPDIGAYEFQPSSGFKNMGLGMGM